MMMKKTIIICVDNGFVQEVHTDLHEDIEIAVLVMDKDYGKINPGMPNAAEYARCESLLKKGDMRSVFEL